MARNVFLSVLGSSSYKECVYSYPNGAYKSEKVRFIQEAMLSNIAKEWSEKDAAYIFLTKGEKGSRIKNWIDKDSKTEGLCSRLKNLELKFAVNDVDIPDGNSEDEIWQLFEIMFNQLKDSDRLYIDITHSFRYLPLLLIVLVNYAKFLKNISVESITYGNWEAREEETNEAPIVNLTSFALLQDWTSAAKDFIDYGKVSKVVSLLSNHEVKGKAGQNIFDFKKKLKDLEGIFYTVRGQKIVKGQIFKEIQSNLDLITQKTSIKPLIPIADKLKEKISPFNTSEDLMNGFVSAKWCVKHGLIQQAFTIAQETIISKFCVYAGLNSRNKNDRGLISSILSIAKTKKPFNKTNLNEKQIELVDSLLLDKFVIDIADAYRELTKFRNNINHAGFIGDDDWSVFEKCFEKFFNQCFLVIEKMNSDAYKPL